MCTPEQETEYLFFLFKYFSFSAELFEKHVLISFCVIVHWGFYTLMYFNKLALKVNTPLACNIVVWNKTVTKSYFSSSAIACMYAMYNIYTIIMYVWYIYNNNMSNKRCMMYWMPLHQCLQSKDLSVLKFGIKTSQHQISVTGQS